MENKNTPACKCKRETYWENKLKCKFSSFNPTSNYTYHTGENWKNNCKKKYHLNEEKDNNEKKNKTCSGWSNLNDITKKKLENLSNKIYKNNWKKKVTEQILVNVLTVSYQLRPVI